LPPAVGVKPAGAMTVPSPETGAAPRVRPPVLQVAGGLSCGPKTSKVTVPVGDAPPEMVATSSEGAMAVPTAPLGGADSDRAGVTTPRKPSPTMSTA
jgi:hypothetical protein